MIDATIGFLSVLLTYAPGPMMPAEFRPLYEAAKASPAEFCAKAKETIEAYDSLTNRGDAPKADIDVFQWNVEELTCRRDGSAPTWKIVPRKP